MSETTALRWAAVGVSSVLVAGFVLSVGVSLAHPTLFWAPALVVLLLVVLAAWGTAPRLPSLHAALPMGGVFILAGVAFQRSDGLDPEEALFAVYYIPFLIGWFGLRGVVYGDPVLRSARDSAMALLLVLIGIGAVHGLARGASLALVRNDIVSLSMFAFYFPVRELCARYTYGVRVVFFGILFMAFVALIRNLLLVREVISAATYAWEIARVRALANEMTLATGAVLSLSAALAAGRLSARLGYAALSASLIVGVILTQWRAFYVALAMAVVLLAFLAAPRERARLAGLSLLGVVVGTGTLFLVFGEGLVLVALGIADRALSIGTAGQADISLINRFAETRSVVGWIASQPVIGHGLGIEFGFFDMIERRTWVKPYAHNGYLTIWFKMGVLGLGAMLWVWGQTLIDGLRTLRMGSTEPVILRAAVCVLVSVGPAFLVSAPFTTPDTTFCFSVLLGLVGGIRDRALT